MAPVTRNQSKGEVPATPSGLSSAVKSPSSKMSEKKVRSRIDPLTGLTSNTVMVIGLIVSILFQAGLTHLVMNDKIKLHGKTTVQSLSSFGGRLEFVLRYQALGVLWLVFAIIMVVARRVGTGVVNPLEGHENLIMAQKQVLQNSIEQYLLSFVNQLILATNLAPDLFLRVIPLMNVIFFFARILFWLGYPKYRTAGFVSTSTPIILATFYNTYAFSKFFFNL